MVLGEEVGYSVHFDYRFNRNGKISQIKYLTTKELLREMMRNPMVDISSHNFISSLINTAW